MVTAMTPDERQAYEERALSGDWLPGESRMTDAAEQRARSRLGSLRHWQRVSAEAVTTEQRDAALVIVRRLVELMQDAADAPLAAE